MLTKQKKRSLGFKLETWMKIYKNSNNESFEFEALNSASNDIRGYFISFEAKKCRNFIPDIYHMTVISENIHHVKDH